MDRAWPVDGRRRIGGAARSPGPDGWHRGRRVPTFVVVGAAVRRCPRRRIASTLGIMADSTPGARLDLMTDLACVLLSAAGGMLLLVSSVGAQGAGWIPGPAPVVFGVDASIGVLASALLWFRRRWPVGVAVGMLVPMVLSRSAQLASVVSVFNVSLRRRPATAVAVVLAHQVAFIGFSLLWITYPLWAACLWVLSYHVTVVALGMYIGARRGLVASLRDQVGQAEAAQQLMVGQARRAERAAI